MIVSSLAFCDCFIIPLFPESVLMLIAANINNTTTVATNAISVIPFLIHFHRHLY